MWVVQSSGERERKKKKVWLINHDCVLYFFICQLIFPKIIPNHQFKIDLGKTQQTTPFLMDLQGSVTADVCLAW